LYRFMRFRIICGPQQTKNTTTIVKSILMTYKSTATVSSRLIFQLFGKNIIDLRT